MDLKEVERYLVHFQTYKDEKSFEILRKNYSVFLHYFCHKLSNLPLDKDELEDSVLLSFYIALVNYDYEKYGMGALTTYIWKTIVNNVLSEVKSLKKDKEQLTLDEIVNEEYETRRTDLIVGINEEDIFKLATISYDKELIEEMLKCLNGKQREIIKYRFGVCGYPEKKLSELAELFGCTKQFISSCEHNALNKMRKLYRSKYKDLNDII